LPSGLGLDFNFIALLNILFFVSYDGFMGFSVFLFAYILNGDGPGWSIAIFCGLFINLIFLALVGFATTSAFRFTSYLVETPEFTLIPAT
jgi:hypothetical protein